MVRKRIEGTAWVVSQQDKHFCDCGCGQPIQVKIHHRTKGIPRFIVGHRILGNRNEKRTGSIPSYLSPVYPCGHERTVENSYFHASGARRCRTCTNEKSKQRKAFSTERGRAVRNRYAKEYNKRLRLEMISAYGGKCACCGESEYTFLTLEHLGGGGNHERAKYGNGRNSGSAGMKILARLRREGWPKGKYTVLCANCNMATKLGRTCPHQSRSFSLAS